MTIITIGTLHEALKNTLGKKGMSDEKTKYLAEYVLGFFGFDDTVVDNVLRTKDRDVFYMLEEEGILTTFQDSVTIKKGKLWRIHYWVLKKDDILRLATKKEEKKSEQDRWDKLYDDIPEDAWSRE